MLRESTSETTSGFEFQDSLQLLELDIQRAENLEKILICCFWASAIMAIPMAFLGFFYMICLPALFLGLWGIVYHYLRGMRKLYFKWTKDAKPCTIKS